MPYIYKITNNINGKVYIGKTNYTIEKRWKEHCHDYKKLSFQKRPLYRAMAKYGPENFSIEEIENVSVEQENERERYWIEYFQSFKNGYNATIGGDGKPYLDHTLVIATYNQLQNQYQTALKLGINESTVHDILIANNIQTLGPGILSKIRAKNIDMFDLSNNYLRSFASANEAATWLVKENFKTSISISTVRMHIVEVCKAKRKTAYKYIWKYSNIQV